MSIFNDAQSKQDIFDLIKKFDESSLFELEISIPPPQSQHIKIKMLKLAKDNPEEKTLKVTVEDSDGIKENLELKSHST